jgi:hypothetical protein
VSGTGVGAERHRYRERLARVGAREVAEVERPAAMREPAHDHFALADHLLAVDAEVLPRTRPRHRLRPARDHQPPGDQRPGVARPAGLDRQFAEVDVAAFANDFLARRRAHTVGLHVPQRLDHRHQPASIFEALGRLRLFQSRQNVTHVTQLGQAVGAHAERNASGSTEQIEQRRNFVTYWICNQ